MKSILLLIATVTASMNAFAGSTVCTAKKIQDPQVNIRFTMDWELDGTKISFDQPVAWYPEAGVFDVIYSGNVGPTYLVAAHWIDGQFPQLVEIHFENRYRQKGTLKAGDLQRVMKEMGKYEEYTVECQQ